MVVQVYSGLVMDRQDQMNIPQRVVHIVDIRWFGHGNRLIFHGGR